MRYGELRDLHSICGRGKVEWVADSFFWIGRPEPIVTATVLPE